MKINRHLALAMFAAAILLSMVREWSAPVACVRPVLESHDSQNVGYPQ
jgi:hypothetical protein